MDDLIQLMQQIDLNSKVLPEGSYLEMCNRMKNIYQSLSNKVVEVEQENQFPRYVPLFQPIMPLPATDDDDDDDDEDDINEQFFIRDRRLNEIFIKIDALQKERVKFEPWKRMSEWRKKDAIKERADAMGIRLRSYTMEALREKHVVIGDEQIFYKNFMFRRNLLNKERYDEITEEIRCLEEERNSIRILVDVLF
ncbi:hypothetical protein [Dishui Lake phycodnavirus 4]|nr:hypothetical protein [Dishui Lake phycodnavirus 4]